MWSHYGNNHSGLCIEFEVDEISLFYHVKYSKKRPTYKLVENVKLICACDLAEKSKEEISSEELLIKQTAEPYLVKSNEWEYESEYRILISKDELLSIGAQETIDDKKVVRYSYKMPKITKVYLGVKMSDDDKKKIKQLLGELKIPFIEKDISKTEYVLTEK